MLHPPGKIISVSLKSFFLLSAITIKLLLLNQDYSCDHKNAVTLAHISHPYSATEMADNFLNEKVSISIYNSLKY